MKSETFVKTGVFLGLCFASLSVWAADIELNAVPALTAKEQSLYPVNWARTSIGTKLADQDVKVTEGLLAESSNGYSMPDREKTFVVVLPTVQVLERLEFYVREGEGTFSLETASIALSTDSNRWKPVIKQAKLSERQLYKNKFAIIEARYLKFSFKGAKALKISDLGIFGAGSVDEYASRFAMKSAIAEQTSPDAKRTIPFNYGKMLGGARVIYISSGKNLKDAQYMVDDDPATGCLFNQADPTPTVIVDMGSTRLIDQLSANCSAQKGKLDFYLFTKMPDTKYFGPVSSNNSYKGGNALVHNTHLVGLNPYLKRVAFELSTPSSAARKFRLNSAFFSNFKPQATAEPNENGRAFAKISPTQARYIIARWTPSQPSGATTFRIQELAAIGSMAELDSEPVEGAVNQAQTVLPEQPVQIPLGEKSSETSPTVPVVSP